MNFGNNMKMNRENYRSYDAINYSLLSQVDKNPSKVNSDEDVWSKGIKFGTLVDYMCFEPDKVDEEFYVSNADREPSKTAKKLADWILENYDPWITDTNDIFGKATFYNPEKETIHALNDLLELAEEAVGSSTSFEKYGGVDYLKEKILSQNKHVISQELYDKAKYATMTLNTHEFTRNYFVNFDKNVEIQNQVPLLWYPSYYDDELESPAKSLLDIVIINHEEKTVIPVDLKTTSSFAGGFETQMIKWRYYLQASYYWHAVKYVINNHDKISHYAVKPFKFIVLSSKDVNHPYVYTTSANTIICGKNGGIIDRYDSEVRGWIQLIKDLKWHEKYDKWDYSREIYESNGNQELDIFTQ